jgi:hypothetical protein
MTADYQNKSDRHDDSSKKIFTSIRPSPDGNLGLVKERISLQKLSSHVELILNLWTSEVVVDLVEDVVAAEAGPATVDDGVNDAFGGGQVGAPVELEHVADLKSEYNEVN